MLFVVDSRRVSFHNISLSPRLDQVASSRSLWLRSATLLVSDEEKLSKLIGFVKYSQLLKF